MHKPRKSPKALSMTLNSTKFSHSNAPTHYLEKILQKKINKQKNTKSYTIFTKTPVTPPYIKGLNPEKDRTNLDAFTSQTGEAEVTTCLSVPSPGGLGKKALSEAAGAELQPPGKLQAHHPAAVQGRNKAEQHLQPPPTPRNTAQKAPALAFGVASSPPAWELITRHSPPPFHSHLSPSVSNLFTFLNLILTL